MTGDVHLTEHAGHAHELASDGGMTGAELVVAWGGDGTINEVGRALVQLEAEGGATTPRLLASCPADPATGLPAS